jgi:hypothetical protein
MREAANRTVEELYSLSRGSIFLKKLFEKSVKAPKGRNVIAWGIATGNKLLPSLQALKGRHKYSALTGLDK